MSSSRRNFLRTAAGAIAAGTALPHGLAANALIPSGDPLAATALDSLQDPSGEDLVKLHEA